MPGVVLRTRGATRSVLRPILKSASFGSDDVSPTVARYAETMIHRTPVPTMVGFLHALGVHNETDGLVALALVNSMTCVVPSGGSKAQGLAATEVLAGVESVSVVINGLLSMSVITVIY